MFWPLQWVSLGTRARLEIRDSVHRKRARAGGLQSHAAGSFWQYFPRTLAADGSGCWTEVGSGAMGRSARSEGKDALWCKVVPQVLSVRMRDSGAPGAQRGVSSRARPSQPLSGA